MRAFSRKGFLSLLSLAAGTTLAPPPIHADEPAAAPAPESATKPAVAPVRPEDVSIPWEPWPLFDPKLTPRTRGWSGGASYHRKFGENDVHWGIALARLETIEEQRGKLLLGIHRQWGIRIHSPWMIMPILNRYLYEGGLRLGPVEVAMGVSLMPFTFDFDHGRFGFIGPSPGANVRVGFRIGTVRISVRAEREYLWRWGGQKSQVFPPTWASLGEALRVWDWVAQPDAVMTGFVLEITGDQPLPMKRGSHPLILDK